MGAGGAAELRLRALTDFAKALSAARWSNDVLVIVAREAMAALDADSVSLSAWERESGWLRTLVNVGALGPNEEERPTTELYPITSHQELWKRYEAGRGLVAAVVPGGPADEVQRVLVESAKASGLGVPVLVDGTLWGELWATRTTDRPPFTEADLDFAGAVAVQVAAGVGQAEHLARVERLAYSDALTGLANRRVLEDHLDTAIALHSGDGVPVTLVVADLNDLKRINDEHGHQAGDVALRALGHLLSATVADLPGALAGRLGGDEFCILAVGVPAGQVVAAAERLSVQARRTLADGISVGIASTEHLGERVDSASALFRLADAAQYRAKRSRSATPVVAGRTTDAPPEAQGLPPSARRRRTRDVSLDVERVLRAAAAALDRLPEADARARVAAVTAQVCRLGDGSSWWLSRVPAGGDRFYTVDSGVSRVPAAFRPDFALFYEDRDGYAMADYPQSVRAIDGFEVVVEGDDPGADPAESALLALGGFAEMVMAGGRDSAGNAWLAEIFADEISVPVRDYALAFRAAVAMAIAGARVARSG